MSSPAAAQGHCEDGAMVSSSHIVSATASSSGRGVFIHWPCCLHSCFSHIFSLFPGHYYYWATTSVSFPFIPHKYAITEVLLTPLIGLILWQVQLGWHWLCQSWGKFLAAFHRSQSCSHLHHQYLAIQAQYHKKRVAWKLWGKGRSAGSEGIRACAVVTTTLVYLSLPSNGGEKIWRNPSGYHL